MNVFRQCIYFRETDSCVCNDQTNDSAKCIYRNGIESDNQSLRCSYYKVQALEPEEHNTGEATDEADITAPHPPKRIALIAHDGKKAQMLEWAEQHKAVLQRHFLCGTGTTGRLIQEATGLPVKLYKSGPMGGDQQIGALISDGEIDMLVFFWDPLEPQPHDPDIKALLRIATLYDIPTAYTRSTADCLISYLLVEGWNQEEAI